MPQPVPMPISSKFKPRSISTIAEDRSGLHIDLRSKARPIICPYQLEVVGAGVFMKMMKPWLLPVFGQTLVKVISNDDKYHSFRMKLGPRILRERQVLSQLSSRDADTVD